MLRLASFPDFHHQPVGIRLQADRKIGSSRGFEHHPAYAFGRLRDTNSRQMRVSDLNRLAEHAGSQRGIVEVKVDSFRRAQAVGLVLHFALHLDNHGARVVMESADETCHMPVTRVAPECFSSVLEGGSSSATGTGGAGSGCFSTVCRRPAEGAATGAGACGFAGAEWRNFHHTPAPNARTKATSRRITARPDGEILFLSVLLKNLRTTLRFRGPGLFAGAGELCQRGAFLILNAVRWSFDGFSGHQALRNFGQPVFFFRLHGGQNQFGEQVQTANVAVIKAVRLGGKGFQQANGAVGGRDGHGHDRAGAQATADLHVYPRIVLRIIAAHDSAGAQAGSGKS